MRTNFGKFIIGTSLMIIMIDMALITKHVIGNLSGKAN